MGWILIVALDDFVRRARYVSFFAYLLDEFARRHPDRKVSDLNRFIPQAEDEYGFSILMCPRCGQDARGVLGEVRLRPARREQFAHDPTTS